MTVFIKKHSAIILFLVFVWILAFLYIQLSTSGTNSDQYASITIKSGDSVWEIASSHIDQSTLSIEEFVSWIEEHNNIYYGQIKAGETIIIPIEQSKELQFFASTDE